MLTVSLLILSGCKPEEITNCNYNDNGLECFNAALKDCKNIQLLEDDVIIAKITNLENGICSFKLKNLDDDHVCNIPITELDGGLGGISSTVRNDYCENLIAEEDRDITRSRWKDFLSNS